MHIAPGQIDAVMILGKELVRDPDRALRELAARSAAASIALRQGAQWIATLEARLRDQEESGSAIVTRYLEQLGVPRDRLVIDSFTRSTREEALAGAHLARARACRCLGVITASYHVRRTRWYFSQAMPEGRFVVVTPEAFLNGANDLEREWITRGIPTDAALEREQRLERLLTLMAGVASRLPGGQQLEMAAAGLLRRAR